MTDDLFMILCLGGLAFAILGLGCVVGFSWGHHLGTLDSLRPK